MTTNYTHTGRRASTGYKHHSTLYYTHCEPRAGRRHALNAGPGGYVAVCGVAVPVYCDDHRCEERNPVARATDDPRVTCKACLRRKPVAVPVPKKPEHVVFLAACTGEVVRWSTESTRDAAERYAASLTERGVGSLTHPPGYVLNAWVETRMEE